jgi:hypothetical protein
MREVGMTEALTRAHRLVLPVAQSLDVPVLRVLAAAYDAAFGPRTLDAWDDSWHAETFDTIAIAGYFARWEHRLDLFDPTVPAFQCGDLTVFNRGVRNLHPGILGGESTTALFHPQLDRGEDIPPCSAAKAARLLLHLLAYDIAGIRPAAPGDPAGRSGKSFGGQLSPLASAVHLHVTAGTTLKEMLLLNVPAGPRADGDAPVWEREAPPDRRLTRPAAGRMDLWTWPTRRVRLRATPEGMADALAFYDGDRLTGGWDDVAGHDPMTAWSLNRNRQVPYLYTGHDGRSAPWIPARLLDGAGPYSFALNHVLAACARGLLPADMTVSITLSSPTHTSVHKSNVRSLDVTAIELGTVAQLASPEIREHLSRMSRAADDTAEPLLRAARRVWSKHRMDAAPRDMFKPRLVFNEVDSAWMDVVDDSRPGENLEEIFTRWEAAMNASAQRGIDSLHLPPSVRAKVRLAFHDPKHAPASRAPKAGVKLYDVFGVRLSLSQISQLPQCVVSYNTLKFPRGAGQPDTGTVGPGGSSYRRPALENQLRGSRPQRRRLPGHRLRPVGSHRPRPPPPLRSPLDSSHPLAGRPTHPHARPVPQRRPRHLGRLPNCGPPPGRRISTTLTARGGDVGGLTRQGWWRRVSSLSATGESWL